MKVSVVIPSYNCAAYIRDTLLSVVNQTERDLEVIVVDDGSTDDTLRIVQAMAAEDSRISVITQPNSGTPSVGRNKGIRAAQGEFITFLDADDLYRPQKIERELDCFARCPEVDVVFGDLSWFYQDPVAEKYPGRHQELGLLKQAAAFLENIDGNLYRCTPDFYKFMSTQITSVNTQTIMIRRSLLLQEIMPFREDWRVGEDIDLWFRLARRARLGYVYESLAYYRQRPGSLMRDDEHALVGFIRAHGANLERGRDVFSAAEIDTIKSRLAQQHVHLGYLYFRQGRMAEARASYRRARELSPEHYSRTAMWKTWMPYPLVRFLHRVVAPSASAETA